MHGIIRITDIITCQPCMLNVPAEKKKIKIKLKIQIIFIIRTHSTRN